MILVGSRALALRAPFLLNRKPVDFDFICSYDEYENWFAKNKHLIKINKHYTLPSEKKIIIEGNSNIEFELIEKSESAKMFYDLVSNDSKTLKTSFGLVPNLNLLYTLKNSHKYLKNNPYFWKTYVDIAIMKEFGCQILPEYNEFFKLREKETYTYSHPKLNVSKKDFFNYDQVDYKYDHDSIHQCVYLYDRPAYTYFTKDGSEVLSDKKKFFECSEEIKLAAVIEETCVLAIERSYVPYKELFNLEQTYKFALSKVCTSITSGWFRTYAYDNALKALKQMPSNYIERFEDGLKNNIVKPFKL